MDNTTSIEIAKKLIQKQFVNELCKKNVIDFSQCNNIMKKLNEDINKLELLQKDHKDIKNIVLKISI